MKLKCLLCGHQWHMERWNFGEPRHDRLYIVVAVCSSCGKVRS